MADLDVVRAWKDEEYRMSLTPAQRAALPENPAGPVELTDADLTASGGTWEFTLRPRSFCFCPTKSICSLCDC